MSQSSGRLIALDVFRGITIMGMILVNNPGSWSYIHKPLGHAEWHGWTPTDFIFPFFLFIVGTAITLSLSRRKERGDSKRQLMLNVFRRSAIIFAIGFFLSLYPYFNFSTVRIPGVLQRIAFCYLFSALIYLYFDIKSIVIWTVSILAAYWAALMLIPVPGYGAGVLDPAGNLPGFIDSRLLAGHTWKGAPVSGFDPEGILSTIPSVASTLLGVITGEWLRREKSILEKTAGLFGFGILGLIAGEIMHIWIPINKALWTSSYVVFMGGMALVFLAMCIWIIDILGYQKWAKPFIVFGSNAILVFSLSSLTAQTMYLIRMEENLNLKEFIYIYLFASWAGPMVGSLLFAVSTILVWLGLMWILYRKKIFIKI